MKQEAVLEFLLTYGWAILIIVLVVGSLILMNILTPPLITVNSCSSFKILENESCNVSCDCTIKCLELGYESEIIT